MVSIQRWHRQVDQSVQIEIKNKLVNSGLLQKMCSGQRGVFIESSYLQVQWFSEHWSHVVHKGFNKANVASRTIESPLYLISLRVYRQKQGVFV